ncbi:MAG: hypothetical protein ACR2GU_11990 [Rubrobacteraceae bacterium]
MASGNPGRGVLWEPWEEAGLELLHLTINDEPVIAEGTMVGVGGEPLRPKVERVLQRYSCLEHGADPWIHGGPSG